MNYVSGIPIKRLDLDCKAPAPPGIFYHYTSLDTLWAILESDSMRATQARFSNDSEELKQGTRILAEICKDITQGKGSDAPGIHAEHLWKQEGTDIDCYILCFCEQNDILSQWRGYCRNDGVSIGLAFDQTTPHFFFQDEPAEQQCAHEIRLYKVWYVRENDSGHTSGGESTISREDLANDLRDKLSDIYELADKETCKSFIYSIIPLIKHAGFCEENEVRLLIRNTQTEYGGKAPFPLNRYVKYIDEDGLKRPYITISFGPNYLASSCTDEVRKLKLCGLSREAEQELKQSLENHLFKYEFETLEGDWSNNPQIIIGEMEDSAQKETFESIDRILTADESKENRLFEHVKLWCEGHIPVRSILVSPCENQKEVVESIRHYCTHHKFWLKYVQVDGSKTPYRRPK